MLSIPAVMAKAFCNTSVPTAGAYLCSQWFFLACKLLAQDHTDREITILDSKFLGNLKIKRTLSLNT